MNERLLTDAHERPLDFRLYDRDNGQGAGAAAISAYLDAITGPKK